MWRIKKAKEEVTKDNIMEIFENMKNILKEKETPKERLIIIPESLATALEIEIVSPDPEALKILDDNLWDLV